MFPDITCDDIFRLETAHLWLRWLRASDAPAIKAIAERADVAQMTASIPHPYPPSEAERFILAARAATAAGRALILAATLKNKAQTVVGLVSAEALDPHEVEIGFLIAPGQWGRGYATEAAQTLIDTTFSLTETRTIVASSRSDNSASRRVLEKCGFALLGSDAKHPPARGGQHSCDFFRLSRRERSLRETIQRLPPMTQQVLREAPKLIGENCE